MIRFEQDDGILSFSRWTESKKRMIHESSLKILSEIGVEVFHDEARELLHSAGAEVEGILVRIPAQMVENALATAPSSYSLFSTNGEEVVRLEPNLVYFGTGTDMPEFIDPYTGEIRAARLEDCANAAKVAQQCESIDWIAPYALSNDKDPRVSDMYHYIP